MINAKKPIIKINGDYNRVLYVESLYSMALFLHLHPAQEETLFLLGEEIVDEQLLKKITNVVVIPKKTKLNDKDKFLLKLHITPKKISYLKKLIHENVQTFGHDHLKLSSFIFRKGGSIIEDGVGNYKSKEAVYIYNPINRWIKSFLNPCKGYPFGWNNKVKKIYLTGLKDIPPQLSEKVEKIDRDIFLKNLKHILNGYFTLSLNNNHHSKNILILTQTLYDDGFISYKLQYEIYENIVNMFSERGYLVALKAHPRDTIKYDKLNNVTIIKKNILAESLYDSFSKIVSLFSSANLPSNSTEKTEFIHLGHLDLPELNKIAKDYKCSNPEFTVALN